MKAKKYVRAKAEHKPFTRIEDFGSALRGFGGLQTSHIRALKGSKFGAASGGKRLSPEQRKEIEDQMRKDGKL